MNINDIRLLPYYPDTGAAKALTPSPLRSSHTDVTAVVDTKTTVHRHKPYSNTFRPDPHMTKYTAELDAIPVSASSVGRFIDIYV